MTSTVAVVGANGRVGAAISEYLAHTVAVTAIARRPGDTAADLAERAAADAAIVVNAAGVAHLEQPSPEDLERLRAGNVDLPLALARAALARGVSMVHISSVKAAAGEGANAYAASKREAEERLEREFGPAFEVAGLRLIVLRPLALLFPPLDAGKVRSLRFLRFWPSALTPAVPLPVLSPASFLRAVEVAIDEARDGVAPAGYSCREFARSERGTLRDVRDAMLGRATTGGSR